MTPKSNLGYVILCMSPAQILVLTFFLLLLYTIVQGVSKTDFTLLYESARLGPAKNYLDQTAIILVVINTAKGII